MKYQKVTFGENTTLAIFGDTIREVVPESHPKYPALVEYFESTDESALSEEWVKTLLNAGTAAGQALTEISERLSFSGGKIYLDGDLLESFLAEHMVSLMREGKDTADVKPFALFMENLLANPSLHSQEHLFNFLRDTQGFTLTDDGMLLGYKGLNADGSSVTAGTNTVYVNGEPHTGRIPNPLGAIVSIPRSEVDDSSYRACSTGLHVGTWGYASGFGSRLVTVLVNPRDVVSIPNNHNENKMRVCRYKVWDVTTERYTRPGVATTWGTAQPTFRPTTVAPEEPTDVVEQDGSDDEYDQAVNGTLVPPDATKPFALFDGRDLIGWFLSETEANGYAADLDTEAEGDLDEDDYESSIDYGDWEVVNPVANAEVVAEPEDDEDPEPEQVVVEQAAKRTLGELAENPDIRRLLNNGKVGHKATAVKVNEALVRIGSNDSTTEASVRRYRKSNHVSTSFGAKITDALS